MGGHHGPCNDDGDVELKDGIAFPACPRRQAEMADSNGDGALVE